MPVTISIQPALAGWSVKVDGVCNDMIYRSGSEAEAAARALGEALTVAGEAAEIRLHLLDGSLAARMICAPRSTTEVTWEVSSGVDRSPSSAA